MKRYFYSLVVVLTFFIFSGCKKDETPTAPQNHLPKIESLTANPSTVLISTETTLTCIATDEDGDNLTISWTAKRGTFSNGVVGVSVKWVAPSTAGKDTITATVNDGKQTIQGKLEIIVGTIPASPTLAAPANNATEIALSPTLTWNAVSNAVSYSLQVSTSSSFSSFIYNQNGLTNTSLLISGLNSNTTYYWRVNSINIYGTSSWSNVFSFKTLAPPQPPVLSIPTNNATNVSLNPTLSWNILSNAVSYSLQVSIDNSFTSLVYNQSGLTNTSQQISGLSINTTYYWHVSATNSYGTSGWSLIFSFKTGSPPQTPTLIYPTNMSPNISSSPTLSWNSVSNAVSFTLQVSANNLFSSFIYNQNVGSNTNQQISGLSYLTQYYWRVNAANEFGSSSWSSIWSFSTISAPCPGVPPVNYEGKVYNTVFIGNQCWLTENLDVGTIIQTNQNANNNSIIEKYCYNDNPANCNTYGGLYQWNEAMQYITTEKTKGICPTGWHIPTLAEFQTLQAIVNNNANELKAVGQGTGSGIGNNASGFSALLGGFYNGYYAFVGVTANFWSSSNNTPSAYYFTIYSDNQNIVLSNNVSNSYGFSIRCIKD